jgi:hypothetical protein
MRNDLEQAAFQAANLLRSIYEMGEVVSPDHLRKTMRRLELALPNDGRCPECYAPNNNGEPGLCPACAAED